MRRLTIAGNLGQDVEVRTTQGGTEVATLRVATNERVKRKGEWEDETLWVSVPVFGNRATGLAKILGKGSTVAASGMLGVREYEKRDGTKGFEVELRNADVKSIGSKGGSRGRDSGQSGFDSSTGQDFDDGFGGDEIPF